MVIFSHYSVPREWNLKEFLTPKNKDAKMKNGKCQKEKTLLSPIRYQWHTDYSALFHSLAQNSGWDYKGYNCAIFWGGSKHLCWHWPDCEWIPFPTAERAFRRSKDSRKNCLWWPMRQEVPVSVPSMPKSLDYVCPISSRHFKVYEI